MAGQGDLQELLRIFTSRKVPMIMAMKHAQALQGKNLKSIEQIANAPIADLEAVLGDGKLAKSVHTACKSHGKKGKRPAEDTESSPRRKQPKLEPHRRDLDYGSMSPDELEESLSLPVEEDEEAIRATRVVTNRAPLVLAFAVELMRFTMPEQPPSSRLSLGQAVVSANSRAKAVSLGIEKPATGGVALSEGQPKVRVMGREVPVLKRGGYTWSGKKSSSTTPTTAVQGQRARTQTWRASQKLTSRSSTFIAHTAPITSGSSRAELMRTLMAQKPELETATHNAWAVRTRYGASPLVQEASFDDGEAGCGKLMLELMREADVTNTVVVLTRWFGGVMLGPDRWRLMRECVNEALAAQGRTSTLSGEAVWALDPQDSKPASSTIGMAIHRPEGARNYLLRAFASQPRADEDGRRTTTTAAAASQDRVGNLAKVLGAVRLLFAAWSDVLGPADLDRRAWTWYVAVRPEVDDGPAGWGAKGTLDLGKILDLRPRPPEREAS